MQKIVIKERARHILHCIYAHEFEVKDLTEEAALVGIADGTDMTKGRGRLAFDKGNINIHTVTALIIERVEVTKGKERPVRKHCPCIYKRITEKDTIEFPLYKEPTKVSEN